MLRLMTVLAAMFLVLTPLFAPQAHTAASTLPTVTITGVAADNSSIKVAFDPVPGAQDYRVYDTADPGVVKYAGMVHLSVSPYTAGHFAMQPDGVTPTYPYTEVNDGAAGPRTLDVPNTSIEWNLLEDGLPHTLVVQALDHLGPYPVHNAYQWDATSATDPLSPDLSTMLGSDEGPTADGNISINGQAPYTDTVLPSVIAQSAPFTVQANTAYTPLSSDGTQQYLDTFGDSEANTLAQVGAPVTTTGDMTYTLNAGQPNAATIRYNEADVLDSMPMIQDGHFMDTLFDGGTPGWGGNAPHTQYAVMALIPHQTFDFSGGRILHLTEEVDNVTDDRRWVQWYIVPAGDSITGFKAEIPGTGNLQFNSSDEGLSLQLLNYGCQINEMTGPISSTNVSPVAHIVAAPGTGQGVLNWCPATEYWGNNSTGLDNRVRLDAFITQTHVALFADGSLIGSFDFPTPLPFAQATVYYAHYLYHSSLEETDLQTNEPWMTDWIENVPYSDERHWDNLGAEVLPASDVPTDWSALGSLAQPPAYKTPLPTTGTPTNTAQPTSTATSTATATTSAVPSTSATPAAWATVTAQAGMIRKYQASVRVYQTAIARIKTIVTPFP